MYRDSKLGLCLDLTGPEGNVFALQGIGENLASQLDRLDDWRGTVESVKLMGGGYMSIVNAFATFFPMVTLIGYESIQEIHDRAEKVLEEGN